MKVELGKNRISMVELAELCGGRVVCRANSSQTFSSLCTDSREADVNTLFCAMKGERVDGHDYICKAYELGCRCVLCERVPTEQETSDTVFVVVPDTVRAMNALASAYYQNRDFKVIAVTGSVGKTTTKEFVASALPKDSTYRTRGNFNSVIGFPLSFLEIPLDTRYAVLEMGMSGRGEIELMSETAKPDIAIITNVGTSHLELLGTRENIRDAKLEIIKELSPDGVLLINGDNDMLADCSVGVRTLRVGIERKTNDYRAVNIVEALGKTSFDIVTAQKTVKQIEIPTIGKHNIYNAMFAYVAASLLGVDENEIRSGLSRFEKPQMRQNIYGIGNITIIEDCYNASPESVKAALEVQRSIVKEKGGRAVALLGDMLELGQTSETLHEEVGEYAAKCGVSALLTYGRLAENIAKGAKIEGTVSVTDTNDPESAANELMNILRSGDVLLVKASRGVAAEKVIEIIKKRM